MSVIEMPSITCPRCGMTSHNRNDVAEGYCGNCHWWTGDPILGPFIPDVPTTIAVLRDDGVEVLQPSKFTQLMLRKLA